jgi:hypothetical protein
MEWRPFDRDVCLPPLGKTLILETAPSAHGVEQVFHFARTPEIGKLDFEVSLYVQISAFDFRNMMFWGT